MFKRILFPIDFSDLSKKAVDYIKQLRDCGSQTVIVLHVIDQRRFQDIARYASKNSLELELEIINEAQRELHAVEEELKKKGFEVASRLETGIPLLEILKIEEEEDVSITVIGSHGKSNLKEMLIGSTAEKVARKCKKPVLIIKR